MVDLGFDDPGDPTVDSTDMPEEQVLSLAYLRLMEGFRPEPDWWQYALETVPGTLEVVVLDFPALMTFLNDEQVAHYGHERLREAGLRNLAREEPDAQVLDDVVVLTGSDYTASTALVLPDMIARVTGETDFPNGVLVSMPERQIMTYHLPRDEGIHQAVQIMINITLSEFDEGHKPISRHLYWWDRGEFFRITSFAADGTVNVHIDGEFADVFHRVSDIPVGQG